MQSFGCVLKRRCTERCTFSENLPEGWNGGTALEKKQEDGRFCRAYLRTMDPEQAAAEIGRRDGYAMLGQKGTQQKLERMRCDAAAQLKREDVLRQLALQTMSKAQETQNVETTEQVQEKEHSPKFWDIKSYYDSGFWNNTMVKNAVKKKKITAEEYTEITGKQYQ